MYNGQKYTKYIYKIFSSVLLSLLIIYRLINTKTFLDYYFSHPLFFISLTVIIALLLFIFNPFIDIKKDMKNISLFKIFKSINNETKPSSKTNKNIFLIIFIIILLIIFINLMTVFFSGFHYVVIGYRPNNNSAVIAKLKTDNFIKQKGNTNFIVRAYGTGGENDPYLITIGQFYLSKANAEKALREARKVLGNTIIPDDAYVYTYRKINFKKRIIMIRDKICCRIKIHLLKI